MKSRVLINLLLEDEQAGREDYVIAMPISLKAGVVATRATICVLDPLSSGHPERI